MYDNITFKIDNYSKADFDNFTNNLGLKSKGNDSIIQADWQNLRINYFPNAARIKVSNSLHKFYNAEIEKIGRFNHNDFTSSQMQKAVEVLETAFGRTAQEMKLVGRFEYGLNIDTGAVKPYDDIVIRYKSIVTTATNPFNTFYNPYCKPYAKFCSFTHYTVKCYDKGKQMQSEKNQTYVKGNILRYEIVHPTSVQTRAILSKNEATVADLTVEGTWNLYFSFLQKTYNKIRVMPFPTDDTSDYSKMLCYADDLVSKDYKKQLAPNEPDMKKVHDEYKNSADNPHAMVSSSIREKFNYLLKN